MKKSVLAARALGAAFVAVLCGFGPMCAEAAEGEHADLVNRKVLRVCSDPANMPFSNEKEEGFENKIADIVADELKLPKPKYTWFPQSTGFVRRTLFEKRCDVIIGFAQGDELVHNTNHYYRSTYILVYPKGKGLDGLESLSDPRLKGKHIGVVAGTPPGDIMAKEGLMGLARPYQLFTDRRYFSPNEEMIKDIRSGEIAAGVLWGPIGGYYAARGGEPLVVAPLLKEASGPRMAYRITMGVRQGEDVWKHQLNDVIAKRQGDIDAVLLEYGVPLIDEQDKLITAPRR